MGNLMIATALILGLLAVSMFNAYVKMPFIASFLIGMIYGVVAIQVCINWAS